MTMPVKQLVADANGHLIVVRVDGSVSRQVRPRDALSGDWATIWETVATDDLDSRVTQITFDPRDQRLIALTADGGIWRQHRIGSGAAGRDTWQQIPGPEGV
jgi:hypothetical protein